MATDSPETPLNGRWLFRMFSGGHFRWSGVRSLPIDSAIPLPSDSHSRREFHTQGGRHGQFLGRLVVLTAS